MTREQAIGNLRYAKQWKDRPTDEAFDIAIKALKHEEAIEECTCCEYRVGSLCCYAEVDYCKDTISRQAAIDGLNKINGTSELDKAFEVIENLPPVQPKQETVSKESYDAEYFARKDAEFQLYKMKQESCEDAISRKDVIEAVDKAYPNLDRQDIKQFLYDAKSVNPKQKTGHWIFDQHNWHCSECGESPKTKGYVGSAEFMAEHFKYCNHCGTKMVEPQESEE